MKVSFLLAYTKHTVFTSVCRSDYRSVCRVSVECLSSVCRVSIECPSSCHFDSGTEHIWYASGAIAWYADTCMQGPMLTRTRTRIRMRMRVRIRMRMRMACLSHYCAGIRIHEQRRQCPRKNGQQHHQQQQAST